MLTIDGKEFRNLEEQVLKNQSDIKSIINEQGVLNQFGIKVIGQVEYLNDLPTPAEYEQSNPNFEYGDAYAVGIQAPYSLYILTRANANKPDDYWFNIGQFPMPGPEGKAGESADITVESTTTTLPGSLARVENTGDKTHAKLQFYIPAGKKGDQGITPTVNIGTVSSGSYANVTNSGTTTDVVLDFVLPKGESIKGDKGDPGDSFKIIGTLDNTNQLPAPTEAIRSNAYLIADNTGRKHLWVITGDTTLLWTDAGAITGIPGQAATINVGGTVTLPAGSQAKVENAGTQSEAVLNFSIPRGADGSAATVSIGSVSTLPAGSQATVTNIGTSKDAVFNFGIPKGDKGNTGDSAEAVTITSSSTATSGTLTEAQLTTLQSSDSNYIVFNNEIYRLDDKQFNEGFLIYSHVGQDNNKEVFIKEISITISTKGWVLTKFQPQSKLTFDTTPTANSTNPVTSGGVYDYVADKTDLTHGTATLSSGIFKSGEIKWVRFGKLVVVNISDLIYNPNVNVKHLDAYAIGLPPAAETVVNLMYPRNRSLGNNRFAILQSENHINSRIINWWDDFNSADSDSYFGTFAYYTY